MNNDTRVVIVNFNAGDALQKAVAAVLATREPLHLVVADNASTDGSCEKLRGLFGRSSRITILENGENLGFARAVNACVKQASEPYILILNPDCELYPDTLGLLREALVNDPESVLAAPRVLDRQEQVLRGTLRAFPDPWKALVTASGLWRLGRYLNLFKGAELSSGALPASTTRVQVVSGACMLVRREEFVRFGGLDEEYGMHFEDVDLMYRFHQANLFCLLVPAARAFHQPGTSSRSRPIWVHRQKHLGMQRFFRKHYSQNYSVLSAALVLSGIWMHYAVTLPLVLLRE